MTIKDMELLTGLTKANIRFYEQEGLIAPPRESNGYRSYGEAELGELRRIRLLRSLGVSIEQIRAMQAGTLGLLFLEPLALSRWGTTAGKWVMGLRIEHESGGRLTYSAAFTRTGLAIVWGLGLGIPGFNLVRYYRSYRAVEAGEALPWDDDAFVYTARDERPWRVIAALALCAAAIAAAAVFSARDYVPPHRGEMTAEEFAGNYNAVAQHENMTWAGTLDAQTLAWSSAFRFSDGSSVAYPPVRQAEFTFDAEGGTLSAAVSLTMTRK